MDIQYALYMAPGFVIGLTVHEAAHAITSRWLGDNLAGRQGRITLNPLKHLSPLGTLMLFVVGFGWGNPVQVNLYNYKHPKRDYLISSLAGPVSNIIMAALSFALVYIAIRFIPANTETDVWITTAYRWGVSILFFSMIINVVLAVINLIPIPPLDGSKIWPCLIPGMRPTHSSKMMWIWIIVLIIMLKTGATGKIINPIINRVSLMALTMAQIQTEQLEQTRPKDFPDDLYAPPEAEDIEYKRMGKYDGKECYLMKFFWYEQEPAPQLTDWLDQYTKEHRWQLAEGDYNTENWEGKKDESGSWLFTRCYYLQPDENSLQLELYRHIDPNSSKPSKWISAYFYYYEGGGEEVQ